MNEMNEILRHALSNATGALFFLDDCGATATSIKIRSGRPVIELDGAPPRFITGALRKCYPVNGQRESIMVAMVQGCQVEWAVRGEQGATARVGA